MARKRYYGWAGHEGADSRDYLYSVSHVVAAALPAAVDLSSRFRTQPWNQGALGSCGPQTAAADLLYDQEQTPDPDTMPSRLFVYYNTRRLMGTVNQDSGVYNRDLCKAIAQWGWADEKLWPYTTSQFRKMPPQNVYDDGARRKGKVRYERVQQKIEVMKGAIAQGDPFIFGFTVYENIEQTTFDGMIPMPAGNVAGGHDVLICGYDDARQAFRLRNSWGTGWGDGGYGWIPYAYATNPRLAGDFWTLHHVESDAPPPDPRPIPPILEIISQLIDALRRIDPCEVYRTLRVPIGFVVSQLLGKIDDPAAQQAARDLIFSITNRLDDACPSSLRENSHARWGALSMKLDQLEDGAKGKA